MTTMRAANFKSSTLQESFAACLHELDDVVVEVKQMIEDSRRIDDLLKTIGVAHGLTQEQTIALQNEHAEERQEYQALQDAYRFAQRRISTVATQARQCLVDGFPATEDVSDEFETLMIRYSKLEVQPDIFILKVRGLILKASEIISPRAVVSPAAGQKRTISEHSRRTPDIEKSRERIALCDQLSRELATLHLKVKKHTTVEMLRMRHPRFKLWEMLSEPEQRELLNGEFKPRAYADHLTLRNYGLTSTSTLKKDRKKLRDSQERAAAR